MKLSVILQCYKRPKYLHEQIEAIKNQTISPDEIIVVHNESEKDITEFNFPKNIDRYFYCTPNQKYHIRFAIGLTIQTDYLFFFDDDNIPMPEFFETALELISKKNCIVVGNGRLINLEKKNLVGVGWVAPNEKEVEVDFGGHVWGIKKEHLKYMWFEEPKIYTNCEDMMLSFNAYRFGGIKTYCSPHSLNNKKNWSADPKKSLEYGSDENASWIVNKNFWFNERWKIIEEYINFGYIPVLKRNGK